MRKYSDLHAHLGSMVTPRKLWELAHEQGIKLPTKNFHKFIDIISGNNDDSSKMNHEKYLNKFNLTQKIQSSPLAIELSVFNSIADAYINSNVTLLELRFNPMLRNNSGYFDLDMIISHACIGLQKARSIYPVKAGLIISTDRSFDEKTSLILAEKASKFMNVGVVGFDMSGGNAKNFDITTFKPAFNLAKDNGLLSETLYILEHFSPDRIGHGIKMVNDSDLMRVAEKHNVHFEVCPTSNVITKCVDSYIDFEYIISEFDKYDVSYSINTDGTVFLNTDVPNEYNKLISHNILTPDDVDELEKSARKNSFIK